MRSVKSLLAAGAATLISSMAFAADMPIAAPPPMYAPPAPPADFGGWYLRGDIGMTNQSMKSLHSVSIDRVNTSFPGSLQDNGFGFDSSPLYKLGVGYQFNNWFRADLTGEYRGKANLHGSQNIPANSAYAVANNQFLVDNYSGSKSEWVVMANAYVDLGTWWCVTPYIGAGIGGAYNRLSGFRDDGVISTGGVQSSSVTYAGDSGKWNLAWAVHAGLAYKVTPNVTLDLAYRYINLGDAVTGPTHSFDGVTVVNGSPFTVKDITSHDLMLGVRWNLDQPTPVYHTPLVTKG
ncbi:outer membrane beta-barrel protein [Bradyrhizobium sp. CSA207]|uniref:outer membrane protein n=1 Tax=Bradyrhizobium sp. CSA207 TaxID=2698826 RepID=UPI0023B0B740|nr:outer membrane beta-barrel protein [Bradyrhizobium sp. CSA207]MDE5446151.1 outer membrane beta-barrel protein [Bradyrhizobium sp. CSA207]